ncbi:hypothetical protein SALBM311S_02256 [Streptomyces alboniger]
MLPTAAVRRPAALRIEASIWTVLVLPLVPVTASQGAASRPPRPRSRQASSTSPQTGTPACTAAANSGLSGFQPGVVTMSSVPCGRVAPSPRRTVMPRASSSAAWAQDQLVVAVVDRDDGAESVQRLGRRDAGDAESGDGDAFPLPVGHFSAAHPA